MNVILLVDDEFPTIEAIKMRVDWKRTGFDQVLTADSAKSAKQQLTTHTVKVLLCDIEMPGETGLDLLQWMRTYAPDTIGIFLTCHADFTYAKEAVRMGAFDYLLKPASIEDIEAVTKKALEEWEKRQGSAVREKLWKKNKTVVTERFWWELLNNLIPGSREKIAQQIQGKYLPVEAEDSFLLMSCVIRHWNLDLSVWEKYDLDFMVKNILNELFGFEKTFLISDTVNRKWIVFECSSDSALDLDSIGKAAEKFLEYMKQYFQTKACFYMGELCRVEELCGMYKELGKLEKNNVSYDDRVFRLHSDGGSGSREIDDKEELELWRTLLLAGKGAEVCAHLKWYVRKLISDGRMNAEVLLMLYHDVLQMVYSVLTEHNISARQLLGDFEEDYRETLDSSGKMVEQLEHMIHTAVQYMEGARHQEGVIGEVKQYIEEHLGEDLSRNTLAGLAYLNPNYFARLFRSKTGLSLVDYITKRKMERVQKLLLTTDLSVTQIARELGYTNMPYFSKVFKKETGCSPVEYRKKERYQK